MTTPSLSPQSAPSSLVTSPKRRSIPSNITLREDRGETGPIITCQGCGTRILDYTKAGIVWQYGRSSWRVLCKFREDGALGCLSAPQWKRQPWMELCAFLGYLLHNAGLRTAAQFKAMRESIERGF